ncbi:conserved exported hypothetical protein [Candidatus Terasakiella magnetica]|nr:conserved exported hypothetical protein [Candidatus Terasakiella magnetica]
MNRARYILLSMALVPLLTAAPGLAVEQSVRLVPGGAAPSARVETLRTSLGEVRTPVLSVGPFSLGALSETAPSPSLHAPSFSSAGGALAVGGYVAFGLSETRISTAFRGSPSRLAADVSAAYAGSLLGSDSIAALRLGAGWAKPSGFSPNAVQMGPSLADPFQSGGDVNLSLSLIRDVTPSVSFSGLAEAVRGTGGETHTSSGFMLGAGMGYRF